MSKYDGKRTWTLAALVNEMDRADIEVCSIVSEFIESSLLLRPVIAVFPIGNEFPEVMKVGTGIPARTFYRTQPPSVVQSLVQVTQDLR